MATGSEKASGSKTKEKMQEEEETRFKVPLPRTSSLSSLAESESGTESRKRYREKESPEKLKRKKVDSGDEEFEVEFSEDPLRNIDIGIDALMKWIRQSSVFKLITKPQLKKFDGILSRMREFAALSMEERGKLGTISEAKNILPDVIREVVREEIGKASVTGPTSGETSYAAALRTGGPPKVPKITGVKGQVRPAPKLVIIRQEGKEGKEVEATLKKLVKPAAIGLKVKRLTNIKNGVIVEAEDNTGAENLLNHQGLKEAGLSVGKPVNKKPVVMIYDVGKDLKDDEIRKEVFSRNFEGSGMNEEEFNKEFEVKHRYTDVRSKGARCHIVVECSVGVRNWVRRREKIFIEWQSCRVKDYIDVARCYKCQRYGHVAKHCSSVRSECSFCAGEHAYKECPNKEDKNKVCCSNCKREGRQDDKHDAGWRGCPSYERAVKRLNGRIDYGV